MERLTRERASYSKNKAKLDKNHSLSDQER